VAVGNRLGIRLSATWTDTLPLTLLLPIPYWVFEDTTLGRGTMPHLHQHLWLPQLLLGAGQQNSRDNFMLIMKKDDQIRRPQENHGFVGSERDSMYCKVSQVAAGFTICDVQGCQHF